MKCPKGRFAHLRIYVDLITEAQDRIGVGLAGVRSDMYWWRVKSPGGGAVGTCSFFLKKNSCCWDGRNNLVLDIRGVGGRGKDLK